MPNWVYNSMSVTGSKEDLIAFRDKASAPRKTQWLSDQFVRNEKGENVKVPDEERTIVEDEEKSDLSFWNFICPPDENLPYYFGHLEEKKPEGYDEWDRDKQMAHNLKFEGRGWYDWNITNWGCKWDAGDVDLTDSTEDKNPSLEYTFQTAWSIPEPVFRAMVEQHPELDFDFHSEEEQGWGAEFTSSDGDTDGERSLILTKEWDIPASHADYVDLDRTDSCVCSWESDPEEWFSDCPKPTKVYSVVVERTYLVTATDPEQAWETALNSDLTELVTDEDEVVSAWVRGGNGERLYPTLGDGKPKVKECEHKFVPHSRMVDGVETRIGEVCVFCNKEQPLDTETASV